MKKTKAQSLPIGAHVSAAGGVFNALKNGQTIGATCIQLFTSNQKQWISKPITPEVVQLWEDNLKGTGIKHVMSHDSYLINLGCPESGNLEKSRIAFRQELERCIQLKIDYLNFHPGAALKEDPQRCLDVISESLLQYQDLMDKGDTRLLLESTAGQGSALGHRFEHLGYIIKKVENKIRIGVCIDTCHAFAAGYDIRTPQGWDATLNEFDKVVGLKHLYAFHVNDSAKDFGTRVDRHADIGKGKIGLESFKFLMQDPRTRELPKYLETPTGPEVWEQEIALLRSFAE